MVFDIILIIDNLQIIVYNIQKPLNFSVGEGGDLLKENPANEQ